MEALTHYEPTIIMLGTTGILMLVQLLVADAVGMLRRHKPGHPVEADHTDFLFRATRALGNTNESVAIFVLLALSGMLSGASPGWLNLYAVAYVAARVVHMLAYYAKQGMVRSSAFAISVVALAGMAFVTVRAWFA